MPDRPPESTIAAGEATSFCRLVEVFDPDECILAVQEVE